MRALFFQVSEKKNALLLATKHFTAAIFFLCRLENKKEECDWLPGVTHEAIIC